MDVGQVDLSWRWSPKKRSRDVMDVFFEEGDRFCCYSVKQLSVVLEEEEEDDKRRVSEFPCCIAGCPETFSTVFRYESHYNSVHRYTCTQCRRSFPSNHLLEVHLRESYDPLFQIQTGNKYLCLVQGCPEKFASTKSRRNHMINFHKYPANYRFDRSKNKKDVSEKRLVGTDLMDVTQTEGENIPQEGGGSCSGRVFSYKTQMCSMFCHKTWQMYQPGPEVVPFEHCPKSTLTLEHVVSSVPNFFSETIGLMKLKRFKFEI